MAGLMSLGTGFLKGARTERDNRAATRQKYIDAGFSRLMEIDRERREELKQQQALRKRARLAASMPNAQGTEDDYYALEASGIDALAMFQQGRDPIRKKPIQSQNTGPYLQTGKHDGVPTATTQTPAAQQSQGVQQPATVMQQQTPTQALEAGGGHAGTLERGLFGRRPTEGVDSGVRSAAQTAGLDYAALTGPGEELPELSPQAELNIRENPLLAYLAQNPALFKYMPKELLDKENPSQVEILQGMSEASQKAADAASRGELDMYRQKKGIDTESDLAVLRGKAALEGEKGPKKIDTSMYRMFQNEIKSIYGDELFTYGRDAEGNVTMLPTLTAKSDPETWGKFQRANAALQDWESMVQDGVPPAQAYSQVAKTLLQEEGRIPSEEAPDADVAPTTTTKKATSEELAKYPHITSEEDLKKLPKGAKFITPAGTVGIR